MKKWIFLVIVSLLLVLACDRSSPEKSDGTRLPQPPKVTTTTAAEKVVNLKIKGMTCEHCVQTVSGALKKCPGVTSVKVNLKEGKATVKGASVLKTETLVKAVEQAGYKGTPLKP